MATFKENWENKVEIDTLGNTTVDKSTSASWAKLAAGITTITPSPNDKTEETSYWDDEGSTSTDVTGKTLKFAIAGHRTIGDKAQDYVASKFMKKGDEVKTLVRWTDPTGNMITFVGTMTAIVPFGGAANAKQTFSFTISANGVMKYETSAAGTTVSAYDSSSSSVSK